MTKTKFLNAVKKTEKKMASKKKPSAAQLRARAKFTKIMKSGGFKKKKSKSKKSTLKKSKPRSKKQVEKRAKKERKRLGLGSASDIDKSLLLSDISRLKTSKKNKLKIVSAISKRLKI